MLVFFTLFCVVEPGVDELIPQTAFVLSDVSDEGAEVCTATTTGGHGGARFEGHLLAAGTLECDVGRMPLVSRAERDFAGFVVRLDALEDLHHKLFPFPLPFVRRGVRVYSAAGYWSAEPPVEGWPHRRTPLSFPFPRGKPIYLLRSGTFRIPRYRGFRIGTYVPNAFADTARVLL